MLTSSYKVIELNILCNYHCCHVLCIRIYSRGTHRFTVVPSNGSKKLHQIRQQLLLQVDMATVLLNVAKSKFTLAIFSISIVTVF